MACAPLQGPREAHHRRRRQAARPRPQHRGRRHPPSRLLWADGAGKEAYRRLFTELACPDCGGVRLNAAALAVELAGGWTIGRLVDCELRVSRRAGGNAAPASGAACSSWSTWASDICASASRCPPSPATKRSASSSPPTRTGNHHATSHTGRHLGGGLAFGVVIVGETRRRAREAQED